MEDEKKRVLLLSVIDSLGRLGYCFLSSLSSCFVGMCFRLAGNGAMQFVLFLFIQKCDNARRRLLYNAGCIQYHQPYQNARAFLASTKQTYFIIISRLLASYVVRVVNSFNIYTEFHLYDQKNVAFVFKIIRPSSIIINQLQVQWN